MMTLLKVRNLCKSFGGISAVQGLNFIINECAVTSIIGPNGAGKTTVFNMLTGFYQPDSGSIVMAGEELAGAPAHKFFNKGIVRTFQNIRLFSGMTVMENVLIGLHSRMNYTLWDTFFNTERKRAQEREGEQQALRILERTGLLGRRKDIAGSLPYGQQKRLEIARALASCPKLLLLDEPAAGMNPQETLELIQLIRQLREAGMTILVIEHDIKLVMDISDHVLVLDHGIKIAEGRPEEVRNNPRVVEAYLGKGSGYSANC